MHYHAPCDFPVSRATIKDIVNNKNYELNVTLHDIENGYTNYPFLTDEKISWIKSHIHTLSTRKAQC